MSTRQGRLKRREKVGGKKLKMLGRKRENQSKGKTGYIILCYIVARGCGAYLRISGL